MATRFTGNVYLKTEIDSLLLNKADAASVYTKTATDAALNGKANTATTIAGYGITDAYTKTETTNLINHSLVNIREANTSFDCPTIASMGGVSTDISFPGVTAATKVVVGISNSAATLLISGTVTATGIVSVGLFNFGATPVSLGTITITVTALDDIVPLMSTVTYLTGTATYTDTALKPYASTSFTITVADAVVGNATSANFSSAVTGIFVSSYVSAANTVTVSIFNPTTTTLTLTAGTIYVGVVKQ